MFSSVNGGTPRSSHFLHIFLMVFWGIFVVECYDISTYFGSFNCQPSVENALPSDVGPAVTVLPCLLIFAAFSVRGKPQGVTTSSVSPHLTVTHETHLRAVPHVRSCAELDGFPHLGGRTATPKRGGARTEKQPNLQAT